MDTRPAGMQELEPRLLLSAVLTQAVPDQYIPASGGTASIDLSNYFDNTDYSGTVVAFDTVYGTFQVQLFDDIAPATVQNFLEYVDSGAYDGSFIHRNALLDDNTPFVVQGGGFKYEAPNSYVSVADNPPTVLNEYQVSNTRGTIAMAKLGSDPDSATTQWFFNMGDNSANLDNQNGGFTVFGEVIDNGMDIVDQMAATPVWDASSLNSAFTDLPLRDFTNDHYPNNDDLVVINSITRSSVEELTYTTVSNSSPTRVFATFDNGIMTLFTDGTSLPEDVTLTIEAKDQNDNTVQGTFTVHVGAAQESIDGDQTPDLVWRNVADGRNMAWEMTGYNIDNVASMDTVRNTTWYIAATGDFNQDGKNDLLWRNAYDGQNKIWLMDGTDLISTVDLRTVSNRDWVVGGVGDFNNDGNQDILWHNSADGRNTVWTMQGTTESDSLVLDKQTGSQWYIGGVGDFDSDGVVDILWRNNSQGQNKVWLLNREDGSLKQSTALLTLSNTKWVATTVADFNLDSQVDILFRNVKNGKLKVWVMTGTSRRGDRNDIKAMRNQKWQLPGRTSQLKADRQAEAKIQRIKRRLKRLKKAQKTSATASYTTAAALAVSAQQNQTQSESLVDQVDPVMVLDEPGDQQ